MQMKQLESLDMEYHTFLYLTIITNLVQFTPTCCVVHSSFSLVPVCDVQNRVNNGCFKEHGYTRSSLDCCSSCGRDISCTGALMNLTSKMCYHETMCPITSVCQSADLRFKYFIKSMAQQSTNLSDTTQQPSNGSITTQVQDPTTTVSRTTKSPCQNFGVEMAGIARCNCSRSGGWAGRQCERHPYNCTELKDSGYSRGSYRVMIDIHQNGTDEVNTHCSIGDNVNIGILKSTGAYNNNRSWSDYVNGFYHSEDDYWLGLANMLAYNAQGNTKIGIHIDFSSSYINGFIERVYTNFHMRGSDKGFSFGVDAKTTYDKQITTANGVSPDDVDIGDPLEPLKGHGFSTYDNDDDGEGEVNCASMASAGWWFDKCKKEFFTNPLGWSYKFKGGDYTSTHILIPQLNMSDFVKRSFNYVYMYLEMP